MKQHTLITGLLAIIFGGSAAVGVRQYLIANPARADVVRVLVAALPIERGTLVSRDLVATREYPRDLIPTGVIIDPVDALDRSALQAIAKDEPLLEAKLSPKGQRGLAAQIPKGMRAFTINTPNVAAGVAGFVLPGNKVDVLLTVTTTGGSDPTGGGTTATLLQNIEILAVDQRIEAPAENKVDTQDLRSVTLLVTPDQAAKLDLGQSKGTLHLSLRNPQDDEVAKPRPATLADLRLHQEQPGAVVTSFLAALVSSRSKPATPKADIGPPPARIIRTVRGGAREGFVQVFAGAVAPVRESPSPPVPSPTLVPDREGRER